MHLLAVGLAHHSAPLAVRERLALSAEGREALLARMAPIGVTEACLLTTPARTELYTVSPERPELPDIVDALAGCAGGPRVTFEPYLEHYAGAAAARHLLRVATGLEAIVLGNPESLAQVSRAWEHAVEQGTAGPVLGAVFDAAIRAGRRAQRETAIGVGALGIPEVAARLVTRMLEGIEDPEVLVAGAGQTGQTVVRALCERGMRSVTVTNRTMRRAEELAAAVGARAVEWDALADEMTKADVLIVTACAQVPLISAAAVRRAAASRSGRNLLVVDLAVPRAVHADAAMLPQVRYLDVDDLAIIARAGVEGRMTAIPRVEDIVREELARVRGTLDDRALAHPAGAGGGAELAQAF